MSPFFRTVAIATISAFALTGLAGTPASAAPTPSASPAPTPGGAFTDEAPAGILPTEPEGSATSGTGEPHTFRYSDADIADIPAKPKKAKKNTKTLVIMAYSKKKNKATPKLLKKVYFDQVDRWMRWESAGRQGEKGKVTKWLKISKTSCGNYDGVMKKAIAKAKKSGYNVSGYKRIAVYFPHCGALAWDGLGSIGKYPDGKYYVWLNGAANVPVIAHESLHNYGLLHSASTDCGAKSWPKSIKSCDVEQYGDPFDIMGNTDIAMSASSKLEAGWLTKKQHKTIKKGSKTFTITANETASGGLKLVRVYMGNKKYLDIEYRVPGGLDTGLDNGTILRPSLSGVQVRSVKPHKRSSAYGRTIVDVLPNNPAAYASIPAGQSWTAYNKARISVVATTPTTAVVTVTFKAPGAGLPAVPAAPTLSLQAAPSAPTASGAGLISLAPVSGNGMPVLSYDVEFSNGAQVLPASVDALGGSVLSFPTPGLPYGTYTSRVRATNELGAGDWSAWSAPLALIAPLPTIGATTLDGGTVSQASFTYRSIKAIVNPGPNGTPLQTVFLTIYSNGARDGACNAALVAGTTNTYACPDSYYATYGETDFYLLQGAGTLAVETQDIAGYYASRTVNFTVTP